MSSFGYGTRRGGRSVTKSGVPTINPTTPCTAKKACSSPRQIAPATVAFVESGIEALSYRALRGTGLIVSTTGSAIEKPATMARLLKARGYEIVTAFNADKSGDRMADRLRELVGSEVRRDRPVG